jgi:hypothetical protein
LAARERAPEDATIDDGFREAWNLATCGYKMHCAVPTAAGDTVRARECFAVLRRLVEELELAASSTESSIGGQSARSLAKAVSRTDQLRALSLARAEVETADLTSTVAAD